MPTRHAILLASGLVLACAEPPAAPSLAEEAAADHRLISFQALRPGDTLVVTYHAHGCFHDLRSTLTFLPVEEGANLSVTSVGGNLAAGWRLVARRAIAPADLAGLDRLLTFYRGGERRWSCTNHEQLTLSLRRSGAEILRESYQDDSCQTSEDASIVTVGSLLEIVRT